MAILLQFPGGAVLSATSRSPFARECKCDQLRRVRPIAGAAVDRLVNRLLKSGGAA